MVPDISAVRKEGMESAPSKVLFGVQPKKIVWPTFLFNLHQRHLQRTKIRLFADDSLLYRTIETTSDSATLQKDLRHPTNFG